ncbi:MAG: RNA-protein complex protein Nop10 [Methanomicrobiales archaeon]|nr:RNA-protein complex protein Nop10 [Methanomicrobiales archaeon]MDI6875231.1 RNA-protein complex protein Nop10 [Methanomicrobiales archaeon]
MSRCIRRCPRDRTYTLSPCCPLCGQATVPAHPARFSPLDAYGPYRRRMKAWSA